MTKIDLTSSEGLGSFYAQPAKNNVSVKIMLNDFINFMDLACSIWTSWNQFDFKTSLSLITN